MRGLSSPEWMTLVSSFSEFLPTFSSLRNCNLMPTHEPIRLIKPDDETTVAEVANGRL